MKSAFGKDFDFCFKTPFSLFRNTGGKQSDLLIFYCGKIYLIKLSGFLRKRSDVVAQTDRCWQVTSWCVFLSNTSYRSIQLELDREKSCFESNIWNLPKIHTVETFILLLPKPRNFCMSVENQLVFFNSGDRWLGHTVGTSRYLWEALQALRTERGNMVAIDDEQWKAIKKEYRKAS